MYATIEFKGKQYKAEKDVVLTVDKLDAEKGSKIDIDTVLLVSDGDKISVGAPYVKGAKVTVKCDECGKEYVTETDFLGDFEVQGLPTNKPFTVTIEAEGCKPAVLTCKTAGSVNFGEIALEK